MRKGWSRSVGLLGIVLAAPQGLLGCDAPEPGELDQARVRDCSLPPARRVVNLGTLELGGSEARAFAVTDRAEESQRSVDFFWRFLTLIKGACGRCWRWVSFASASGGLDGCTSDRLPRPLKERGSPRAVRSTSVFVS